MASGGGGVNPAAGMTGASRAVGIAVVAELSAVMPVRDIVASGGPAGGRMAARGLRNRFRLASESQATRRPPPFSIVWQWVARSTAQALRTRSGGPATRLPPPGAPGAVAG